jgi:protein-disulfide isomerase
MKNRFLVPGAVVVAALILGLAVYMLSPSTGGGLPRPAPGASVSNMRPVDPTDHILGNPAAPILFVEYGDIDCPYCKEFGKTMEQVIGTYGGDGSVAWVFRHLPVPALHPYAEAHALAAECVAAQGGSDAFFRFVNALHAQAPGQNQFDPAGYAVVVEALGFSVAPFTSCYENETYRDRVEADRDNALMIGAQGTPYTVMLIRGEDPLAIDTALSYGAVTELITIAKQHLGTP